MILVLPARRSHKRGAFGKMWSYALFVTFLVIAIAYVCQKYQINDVDIRSTDPAKVIEAWDRIIKEPEQKFNKVAVGINACVDLIVDAVAVMEAMRLQPGVKNDHEIIKSLEDLQETFHNHFASGAAAERYFADADAFNTIVQQAADIEGAQFSIGGNAALMAQKMAQSFPDLKLQLIGPVGPRLRDLLHDNITVPSDSRTPSDEVHLILEYGVGAQWGDTVAPVATRFITSHDVANSRASSLEHFFRAVTDYHPDLVVLSGLHMLEGQPADVWKERLNTTRDGLELIEPQTPVHLELASMVNEELMRMITSEVIPKVTSLGLNEQELTFLSNVMGGPHREIFDSEGRPEIHKVTDILTWILQTYGKDNHPHSRLSRVHFHSLTFHILSVYPTRWLDFNSAVAAGSRAASLQACDTDVLNKDLSELRIPEMFKLYSGSEELTFDIDNPVKSFTNGGFQFALSPVLVCKNPLKTVGLGDAISATGLLYSTYKGSSL